MLRLVTLVVLVFSIALPVSAANVGHNSTLLSVQQLADGRFVLRFNEDSASCTNANSPRYYYAGAGFNGMTADSAKAALSVALTAFAMGRDVYISFDAATSGCYINSIMIR